MCSVVVGVVSNCQSQNKLGSSGLVMIEHKPHDLDTHELTHAQGVMAEGVFVLSRMLSSFVRLKQRRPAPDEAADMGDQSHAGESTPQPQSKANALARNVKARLTLTARATRTVSPAPEYRNDC